MFDRFRFWLARKICPPVTVFVAGYGRQHFEKNVHLRPEIAVFVPKVVASPAAAEVCADLSIEHKGLTNYQKSNYHDMTGDDAKDRDAAFASANMLRGQAPVPLDVIQKLRADLIEEGKLPE